MTRVVRVVIADLPDLQTDVLAALLGAQPDILVVGREIPGAMLPERIAELAPDVVVLPRAHASRESSILARLAELPEVGVLALDASTGTIERVALVRDHHAWTARVVETIRGAAPRYDARHRRAPEPPA